MKTCTRDKISGHWWIRTDGLSIEAHFGRRWTWDLCDIRENGQSLLSYSSLGTLRIVYPTYKGHVVPNFCSLKAMLGWVDHIRNNKPFQSL